MQRQGPRSTQHDAKEITLARNIHARNRLLVANDLNFALRVSLRRITEGTKDGNYIKCKNN